VILLLPVLFVMYNSDPVADFAFTGSGLVQGIFNFMPVRILTAINEWQNFSLAYLFGRAVPVQYIIFLSAAVLMLGCAFAGFFTFKRHQVEN